MGDSATSSAASLAGRGQAEAKPSAAELEAAGQSALFGGPAEPPPAPPPSPAATEAAQPYRVLARKYRPQTFSELIGQERDGRARSPTRSSASGWRMRS